MNKTKLSAEELLSILGQEFFRFRKELDYSLDDVAAYTGLSVKTLDDIECYRTEIEARTLQKLIDFYRPFVQD